MVRELRQLLVVDSSFWCLHLLPLRWWMLLRIQPLEFQQGHSFRHTYCMYMHKTNIMYAQEMK
jgi:hypothetical protein